MSRLIPHFHVANPMAIEARIYNSVKPLIPELLNVHVPLSGKRFHVYLQLDKTRPGIGKDAILAAKPCYPRVKHIFVVDKDVDIFDDSQVLWAIATRSQWDRDLYILPGGTSSPLDPSAPEGSAIGCNGGIDATMPPPMGYGLPQFFQATNRVPADVMNTVVLEDFCDADRLQKMPGTF